MSVDGKADRLPATEATTTRLFPSAKGDMLFSILMYISTRFQCVLLPFCVLLCRPFVLVLGISRSWIYWFFWTKFCNPMSVQIFNFSIQVNTIYSFQLNHLVYVERVHFWSNMVLCFAVVSSREVRWKKVHAHLFTLCGICISVLWRKSMLDIFPASSTILLV